MRMSIQQHSRQGHRRDRARPSVRDRARWHLKLEQLEARNLLTFFGGYHTVIELYSSMADVANNFPQIAQVVDFGQSYAETVGGVTTPGGDFLAGNDLMAMHITNQNIAGPKPVFFLNSGIHAREISGPEVAMRWVNYLTQNYGVDPDVTWIVDYEDIWVVPDLNPDGHQIVELGTEPPYNGSPFEQRKNADFGTCTAWPPGTTVQPGVDLNRNFDDHWGLGGSDTNPCSQTTRGASAASEPETQALQNLIDSLIPAQRGPDDNDPAPDDATGIYLDMHTYGGEVLWPWGHTTAPPPNAAGLSAIGRKFASYNHYIYGQTSTTLYTTSGTTDSYVYGRLGAPGFTVELDSQGFLAPYSTVDDHLWPINQSVFLYAARIARTPYMTVRGPDSTGLSSEVDGSSVIVHATIDHTHNANRVIASAEFYVDTPPWVDGAQPYSLGADDGDFDTAMEGVSGSADSLDPGQHTIFIRGEDVEGNWGPVSAMFVTIGGTAPGGLGRQNWSRLVGGYFRGLPTTTAVGDSEREPLNANYQFVALRQFLSSAQGASLANSVVSASSMRMPAVVPETEALVTHDGLGLADPVGQSIV